MLQRGCKVNVSYVEDGDENDDYDKLQFKRRMLFNRWNVKKLAKYI